MVSTRKTRQSARGGDVWLSLPKAAAILGRHRQTVANMAARDELGSIVVDDRLFVSRADVERLAGEQSAAA